MSTVLITGGAGFVGRHLADHLTEHGFAVRVIDNESLGDRDHLNLDEIEFISGDIRDSEAVAAAMTGVAAVVHLAADTRVMDSIENPAFNFENNVLGSFNVLQAARDADVERFIAASTGGAILGEVTPPVHEEMAPHPTSPYGASKLMLEGYMSAYAAAYGLSTCALRFSNIYGPRSFHKGSVVAHFFKQLLSGEPLTVHGDGSQQRDYLYAGDLVAGIRSAIETPSATGAFQLGSGRPTSINELLQHIRSCTGLEPDVRYADFRDGEVRNTWCNVDKAKEQLGFSPGTPLDKGLAQTWSWFSESAALGTGTR